MSTPLLVGIGYGVAALVAFVIAARQTYNPRDPLDGESLGIACAAAVFWPLLAVYVAVGGLYALATKGCR